MNDEFEFIKRIKESQGGTPSDGVLAIGDDCSAIPFGASLYQVTSTDCLVENIHFRTATTTFEDLGRKALAVNLSDIASMGAKPQWCHLTVAIPKTLPEASAEAFFDGFLSEAARYEVTLLGGDLSASPRDIFINVCISGIVEKEKMKTRRGFTPGAEILHVGSCGESALGLAILESSLPNPSAEALSFIQKHRCPKPMVEEGQWLADQASVLGMMDTSDGILSTVEQLSKNLGVGFSVDCKTSWFQEGFEKVCRSLKLNPADVALTGGEDYGLLVSVEAGQCDDLLKKFKMAFATPVITIGKVEASGIRITENGHPIKVDTSVFNHFS